MDRSPRNPPAPTGGEIIAFDEILLASCPPDARAELMAEAELMAQAFAPDGQAAAIRALARRVESGVSELERGRGRAVRLAAALRRLAKAAEG